MPVEGAEREDTLFHKIFFLEKNKEHKVLLY